MILRHRDRHRTDRLEQNRIRRLKRLLERVVAGDLEGNVLGVDGVHLAIVELDFDIGDAKPSENSPLAGGLTAFLEGGKIAAVDVRADERLAKSHAAIARAGFPPQPDFRELPGTAGLLFVPV